MAANLIFIAKNSEKVCGKNHQSGGTLVLVLLLFAAVVGVVSTVVVEMGSSAINEREIFRARLNKERLTNYLEAVVDCNTTNAQMMAVNPACGGSGSGSRFIELRRSDDTVIVPLTGPETFKFGRYNLNARCGLGYAQKMFIVEGSPDSNFGGKPVSDVIINCS